MVYKEFSLPRAEGNCKFIHRGLKPAVHLEQGLLRMSAAVIRAIGYLNDIIVNFNRLVIVLSGIMHNASYCVKIHCIIYGGIQLLPF